MDGTHRSRDDADGHENNPASSREQNAAEGSGSRDAASVERSLLNELDELIASLNDEIRTLSSQLSAARDKLARLDGDPDPDVAAFREAFERDDPGAKFES